LRIRADPKFDSCLAFSPDGKWLYTVGNDPELKRWQVSTGKPAGAFEGHTGSVHDLSLSKDGKVMATAGSDKRVLIWQSGDR